MEMPDTWERERARLLRRCAGLEPVSVPLRRTGGTLRIALACPADAERVHQLLLEAFAEHLGALDPPSGAQRETVADVEKAMTVGGTLLAWEGPDAVGTARFTLEPDHLYIGRVGVLPTHRGRGIASALMSRMEDIARLLERPEIRLGTRQSLQGNIAFYQGLGYEMTGIHQHPRGKDQVVWFTKRLTG